MLQLHFTACAVGTGPYAACIRRTLPNGKVEEFILPSRYNSDHIAEQAAAIVLEGIREAAYAVCGVHNFTRDIRPTVEYTAARLANPTASHLALVS